MSLVRIHPLYLKIVDEYVIFILFNDVPQGMVKVCEMKHLCFKKS
jgi:hypothetical protein